MADNLLDKASILLTPTAYDNGSMLSIKPTNGDGDFTFSRNGNGSRVNSSGIIVTEGANLPRINYENGCGSWLLEPQSTNIYLNSETLSTQNNTTLASTYTVSFYGTGTITFSGTHTGSLVGTSLTDRVSATFTATAGTLTSTVTGTVTKGQLEQQSYATSYIPTLGASSTRLQDLASGSGNSTLINSTEGVLYAEIAALANSVPTQRLALSSGNNTNRIYLQFSTTLNRIFVSVVSSSSIVVEMGHTLSNITNFNKIAVKYKQDDFALWINGVEVATDTSGATPLGLSELAFDDGNGSLPFYGKTKALAVFPYLTDAELTLLTTI